MPTALVLSAGGMFAAWEVGVWQALRDVFVPDMIVGVSAGAWNGWAIAGGASLEELEQEWRNPRTADLLRFQSHHWSVAPEALHERARELYSRHCPRTRFALTTVKLPSLRSCISVGNEITWRHLAATASIPLVFPPVEIDGAKYVDGGLRGALPLWAAERMGATRVIALNCLINLPLRLLRIVLRPPKNTAALDVVKIQPSRPLGSLRDAVVWNEENIDRWIRQGIEDGNRARTSITM